MIDTRPTYCIQLANHERQWLEHLLERVQDETMKAEKIDMTDWVNAQAILTQIDGQIVLSFNAEIEP